MGENEEERREAEEGMTADGGRKAGIWWPVADETEGREKRSIGIQEKE